MRVLKIRLITLLFLVLQLPVMGHSLFHDQTHALINQSMSLESQKHCDCTCNSILDHNHDGETNSSCGIEREFISSDTTSPTSLLSGVFMPLFAFTSLDFAYTHKIIKYYSRDQFYIDDTPIIGDLSPLSHSLRAPPIFG